MILLMFHLLTSFLTRLTTALKKSDWYIVVDTSHVKLLCIYFDFIYLQPFIYLFMYNHNTIKK